MDELARREILHILLIIIVIIIVDVMFSAER